MYPLKLIGKGNRMFGWFKKKKTETKVKVVHNQYVDQRGARAKGDIVGGNKYSSYTPTYDPNLDMLNPLSPLSPLNPINQSVAESSSTHKHHDSGSSWSSHDSSSSSSYDSGSSSSYDSGSSVDSSSY
jgi:hypothetical protein